MVKLNLDEYLSELEYLVNIDSGEDSPEGLSKIADFFKERFEALGWITKRFDTSPKAGPSLACFNREAEHYDLMLIGHMDTVFPKGTVAERPFRIDGDRAYGPGVFDMKHGSLLIYHLMKELPKETLDKLNVIAFFNPDEEIGSPYSEPIYSEYAKRCDIAYIYEGASYDGARCVRRKGQIRYSVAFHGVSGHCGYVFTNGARSAISEMGRFIVAFDALQDKERNTSVNIGVAGGGIAPNVVCDLAQMEIDIRYELHEEVERAEALMKKMTAEAAERGIRVEILKHKMQRSLVPTEDGERYIKRVEEIGEKIGVPFFYRTRGGCSDGNKLSKYGVICVDAMGPAGDDDHCDKEFLRLDSVEPAFRLSAALIDDLANSK